ncbi:MAG: DUF1732 domain-containing protein [Candidatus Bipolaricaulota bacterium]|nr:DUF1732 domain-containing protein [Candidatus Bipolaricaulota bacterium]MDW8151503.1 DUF1732 domain-containing protein [Candidatus Bipolaricaulota bacterium]
MTGFGRGQAQGPGFRVEVDLRSLNGRFLEVRVRGLADFPGLAHRAEERLRQAFARGTLEATVRLVPLPGFAPKVLDAALAQALYAELSRLSAALGLEERPALAHLLALNVFRDRVLEEEEVWPVLAEALDQAIAAVRAAREAEGARLREALLREAQNLQGLVTRAEVLAQEELASLRARLEERVRGLAGVDEARLAAEVALLAERSDVREELDRLRAHVARLFPLLESGDPVGKELEFLAQEIGREAGTLGAKARGPALAEVALALKLGAERVREQARNVE